MDASGLWRPESWLSLGLIDDHPQWSVPVRALGAREVGFRRGFVDWIDIDTPTLLSHALALFAAAPILHARLRDPAGYLGEPVLHRFHALDLRGEHVTDDDLAALAANQPTNLRALDLRQTEVTPAGLAQLDALAGLVWVRMSGHRWRGRAGLREMPDPDVLTALPPPS